MIVQYEQASKNPNHKERPEFDMPMERVQVCESDVNGSKFYRYIGEAESIDQVIDSADYDVIIVSKNPESQFDADEADISFLIYDDYIE